MKLKRQIGLCLFFLMFAQQAWSQTTTSLFSATVPLEQNNAEAREAAFKDALAKVLVKITGRRDAIQDPTVVELVESAPRLVQGFKNVTVDEVPSVQVSFDPTALERMVSNAGLPVWSRERPKVLMWLAVDNREGQRFILSEDSSGEEIEEEVEQITLAIEQAAEERGLPLLLPLYDAEDQNVLSFADIWGGFGDPVTEASARYAPDAILIGRARPRGRAWEVRWMLRDNAGQQSWVSGFADGVHQAADRFAQAFSVIAVEGAATMIVENIASFSDYGRVLRHIQNLSVVEQVDLQIAARETLEFALVLKGDVAVLQRALDLGGVLTPVSTELPSEVLGPPILRYQLLP